MKKSINISKKLKKEIARYAISFFFAWLVSALIGDFPFFRDIIKSFKLDTALIKLMIVSTDSIFHILGFATYSHGIYLSIDGVHKVGLAYGCLGFRELSFFIVFVIFQFGKLRHKAWYIPLGVVLLIFLNIIRIVIIVWGQYLNPNNFQVIHDIVSPLIMAPAILFLWLFWVIVYGKLEK